MDLLGDVDAGEFMEKRQWFIQSVLFPYLVASLSAAQRSLGVGGTVAEIGVHHGGFFDALAASSHPAEQLLALDIFDAQELNTDGSGRGSLAIFEENVGLLGEAHRGRLETLQGDSAAVDGPRMQRALAAPLRLISVDGGHTRDITCHDMNIAEAHLHEGGIVVVDDVGCCSYGQNTWSLGVMDGIAAFFYGSGAQRDLEPFSFHPPKLFLARPAYAARYRAHLVETENDVLLLEQAKLDGGAPMHPTRYTMFGGEVLRPNNVPLASELRARWLARLDEEERGEA